ncbi:hypothetical protein HDU93_000601 [Gonapodya sp. JEL0774]|nr:hypothetical protein HDU93_000601 [Gonapodya sp. JEL0774]
MEILDQAPFNLSVQTLNVEDVKYILSNPDIFEKGKGFRSNFYDLLGDGIFNSDGEHWRVQRKTSSSIFTVKNFRDVYSGIIIGESKNLLSHLRSVRDHGVMVDLQDLFLRSTLDSFSEIAFGKALGCMDMSNASVINGKYVMQTNDFMRAFDSASTQVLLRFINPFWKITDRLTGAGRSMSENISVIDAFCHTIIDPRLSGSHNLETNKQKMDLLDLFIAAGKEDEHPEVEKKLRAEIRSVLGDNELTYESFRNLKYSHAVFYETLRLHANVPGNVKVCNRDEILPGTRTPIPKGTNVEFNAWTMGRLESSWGPDAEEFRPERWLTSEGNLIRVDNFTWPVFNAGPRLCLGVSLATQEAVMFLAQVYRHFHLELVNEDDPAHWGLYDADPFKRRGRYGIAVTLVMKGGVDFKVHNIA